MALALRGVLASMQGYHACLQSRHANWHLHAIYASEICIFGPLFSLQALPWLTAYHDKPFNCLTSSTMIWETSGNCRSPPSRLSRIPVVQNSSLVERVIAASRRTWYPTLEPALQARTNCFMQRYLQSAPAKSLMLVPTCV